MKEEDTCCCLGKSFLLLLSVGTHRLFSLKNITEPFSLEEGDEIPKDERILILSTTTPPRVFYQNYQFDWQRHSIHTAWVRVPSPLLGDLSVSVSPKRADSYNSPNFTSFIGRCPDFRFRISRFSDVDFGDANLQAYNKMVVQLQEYGMLLSKDFNKRLKLLEMNAKAPFSVDLIQSLPFTTAFQVSLHFGLGSTDY